jgi:hypothetical protein
MNGSILLKKFKVNYSVLARQVDKMEFMEAEGNELRGMMQLLPTKDEALALRSYLPPIDAPQSEFDESVAKLGECEQYMAVMLDVDDVKNKFQAMVFRAEFDHLMDSTRDGTNILVQACDSVQSSERFRKVLLYALKLGNALNSDQEVTAITLDSLLKLVEVSTINSLLALFGPAHLTQKFCQIDCRQKPLTARQACCTILFQLCKRMTKM